jgi:Tol biopolymer transport system component
MSDRSGNWDIWIMPSSGGVATQLTTDPDDDSNASWSPDGEWIAFESLRSGNRDIWLIPATGGVAIQLTTDPGSDGNPSWSPDGQEIVFNSDRTGTTTLWIASDLPTPVDATTWGAIKAHYRAHDQGATR